MVVFIQNKVGQWRPSAWEHVNRVLQFGYWCTFHNAHTCIFSLLWAFNAEIWILVTCWQNIHLLLVGKERVYSAYPFPMSYVYVSMSQSENTRIVNIGDGNVRGWEWMKSFTVGWRGSSPQSLHDYNNGPAGTGTAGTADRVLATSLSEKDGIDTIKIYDNPSYHCTIYIYIP